MKSNPLWRELCRFGFASLAFIVAGARLAAIPAFPGAEGFGANAVGGRGGEVYIVTNLNDNGPGSFRDAVSQPNRYVIFAVGGVIEISSRIVVKNNITIAGQTAPGEGITIYGNGLSFSNANNTIARYLRIRMGVGGDSGKDALTIAEGNDMIFDHVSVSWGRDETFSISGENPSNITIQDSMIAQGLQTHSAGGLIQTDGGVSIIRCLYIDNHTRNPKVKGVNEFINSVVYNWGGGGGYILGDSAGQSYVNVVNNYFITGPNTTVPAFSRGNLNFHIYAAENWLDDNRDGLLNGGLIPPEDYTTVDFQATRYPYPTVSRLLTPEESVAHVAEHAGASFARDRVDRRFIEELLSFGTLGEIPTNENDPPINGAYPVSGGDAPADSDGDGMPDFWEIAAGTDPATPDHNGDLDGNGYTNIEDYINALAPAGVPGVFINRVQTDTGSSDEDAVTSDASIILVGSGVPGSTVTISRIGVGVIGTATVDSGGAWTFDHTATTLPEGITLFSAIVTTADGWTSPPSAAFFVDVDHTPPASPVITSVAVDPELTIRGSAEPGSTVAVMLEGHGIVGTAVTSPLGVWSAPFEGASPPAGEQAFTAIATDLAGNEGPESAPFVVDTSITPPAITGVSEDSGSSSDDQLTSDTTLVFHGNGSAGDEVSLTRLGLGVVGSATIQSDGTWSIDSTSETLAEGAHTFTASSSNGSTSSPSSAPFVVTVDLTPPGVVGIERHDPLSPAVVAEEVTFRVEFGEDVEGVSVDDFSLTLTGTAGTVSGVTAVSPSLYEVTVDGISGEGGLRLNFVGTDVVDLAGNAIASAFTSGESYTLRLPGSGVWISTDDESLWSDAFNWQDNIIASGSGATADFGTLDIDADAVVQLDSPRTLGHLVFGDTDTSTAASWSLLGNDETPDTLTLEAASGAPSITVNALGGSAVTQIAVPLASTAGLAKAGTGTAVLSAANQVTGDLAVNRGRLHIGENGALEVAAANVASGAFLEVAGGSLRATGLTMLNVASTTGLIVSGGTADLEGGILAANRRNGQVIITGGVLNTPSIDFPRSHDGSTNYSYGLIVRGGEANVGTVGLGTGNSWGVASIEGGELNVSGTFTIGAGATAGRGGKARVIGGELTVADTSAGIIMSRNPGTQPGVRSELHLLGGITRAGRITMGFDATSTADSATLNLDGGDLYVGTGGIEKLGTGSFAARINLRNGVLGAWSPWASSVDMTLATTEGVVIRAADPDAAPQSIALNGILSGPGGFAKDGAGNLQLAAANTYTGLTAVLAGGLRITGSVAGGVHVHSGASIGGPGSIGGDLVLDGGAVLAADVTATPLRIQNAMTAGSEGTVIVDALSSGPLATGSIHVLAEFGTTDLRRNDFELMPAPDVRGVLVLDVDSLALVVTGVGPTAEFTHWAYEHNLPPGQDGPRDNPAGDGIPNLLKFVLALDPNQSVPEGTVATTMHVDGEEYPAIVFVRRSELGGVSSEVVASSTPEFVSTFGTETVSVTPRGDGTEDVVVRSSVPLSQQAAQFFRITATLPAE